VAASNGMYCHCRLVLTVGINHGLIHKSIEMRMVWLESFPDQNVVLDIVFFVYVIFLIFNEFAEFWQFYKSPNQNLLEQMTEKRYRLRQRLLQYAAFHGIAKYDPHAQAAREVSGHGGISAQQTTHREPEQDWFRHGQGSRGLERHGGSRFQES
jgi:hypothetical protein